MAQGKLVASLKKHPLVKTLLELEGNPRICVFIEPLWGIPYNLYSPFATLFMYNLGVSDEQIGLLLTVGMILQVFASLMGGVVADKWGRRLTTVVFDTLSWSVPCLIWAFSQNFWWFLVATILNATWKVTDNSWTCLLVEDCDPKKLTDVFAWISVSGLLAVFFAPISTGLVAKFSLMPVMRGLYLFSFLSMTVKFYWLFFGGTETARGKLRMQETKNTSYFVMFKEYAPLFKEMLQSSTMVLALCIMTVCNITSTISGTFFSLYIVKDLGIPEAFVTIFPMVRAAVMLMFMFIWQARINRLPFKPPLIIGLLLFIAGQLLLIFSPRGVDGATIGTWGALVLYVLCDACGNAIFSPHMNTLTNLCLDSQNRARTWSLMQVTMIGLCSPFGYIGGLLSARNRVFPFIFIVLLYVGLLILILTSKHVKRIYQERMAHKDDPVEE